MSSTAFVIRNSPAEELLQKLRPLADKAIQLHLSGQSLPESFPAEHCKALLKPLPSLPYHEYRDLVAFMTSARDGQFSVHTALALRLEQAAISPQYKRVIQSLNQIHAALYASKNQRALACPGQEFDDGALDKKFSTDAVILARLLYPLGVCINDANLAATNGIAADCRLALWPYSSGQRISEILRQRQINGWVEIQAVRSAEAQSELAFFPPNSSEPACQCRLSDGSAVLVGRTLKIPNLFEFHFADPVVLKSGLTIGDPHAHWSRAAIMVLRQHGQLYLFDRGSRLALACAELASNTLITYVPSVVTCSGQASIYGQTELQSLPPGHRLPKA